MERYTTHHFRFRHPFGESELQGITPLSHFIDASFELSRGLMTFWNQFGNVTLERIVASYGGTFVPGLINVGNVIENMAAGDEDLEADIVREVASYGRQLGRVIDALDVVLEHVSPELEPGRGQREIEAFRELARSIRAFKTTRARFLELQ